MIESQNYPVENTPFRIYGQKGKGYFIVTADKRISDTFETPKEAENYINQKPWELIANFAIALISISKKFNNI